MLTSILKKIYLTFYSIFINLSIGLKKVENQAFNATNTDSTGIDIVDEAESVYKDLLRGEVTQRVKELRHEMYQADRKSHEYDYIGNGIVKKKKKKANSFNSFDDKFENSENLPVVMAIFNQEDTGGLSDNLLDSVVGLKDKRDFTIRIKRNFIPRMRIEKWASMLTVKELDDENGKFILDIYIPNYESQFDRTKKPFLNELERVRQGFTRSELIDIEEISFTTYNSLGCDDNNEFKYHVDKYIGSVIYDKNYTILKFECTLIEHLDYVNMYIDKIAEEKFENNAPRDNHTITLDLEKDTDEDYDVETALNLLDNELG